MVCFVRKMKCCALSFFMILTVFELQSSAGESFYSALNQNSKNPFVMSVGISMSQTHEGNNTASDAFVGQKFHEIINTMDLATPQGMTKAAHWLKHKDRIGYTLKSLPNYTCVQGHHIVPASYTLEKDARKIDNIVENIVAHSALPTTKQLTLTACPECGGALQTVSKNIPSFTSEYQNAMIQQLRDLHVGDQIGCKVAGMPNFRMSLEASDILKPDSDEIDFGKLDEQAQFIKNIGNPMLFFHHYSNPCSKPDLFNDVQDGDWFANYCAQVVKKSPQVTHVCPISQPIGFAFRVTGQSLSPFKITIDKQKYLNNIADAQAKAAKAMKEVNKDLKVLMSHQWKLMKPKHGYLDPRYYIEKGVCKIAHSMYNQAFVKVMKEHADLFDGIALSLYPPVYFNGWKPEADNCGGIIDEKSALETIVEVHKAFPNKDIYIVETGCNTQDPVTKREFIDMTLRVCHAARDQGIPVKGVYFWGLTNDPNFYSEWNMAPGSTHFGPFDKLELENPTRSINAAGKHIQKILKQDATV